MSVDTRRSEFESSEGAWTLVGPLGLLLTAVGLTGLLALLGLLGLSPSPLTWYLARASGLTLYLLLWLALVSGLGLTTKLLDLLGGRRVVWDLHRLATELAYSFLALHLLALAADPSVPLGIAGVLLPFTSGVRQPWTDIGILAAYGFLAVAASFSLRRFIGTAAWRALHYATFPLWAVALLHGVGAGSDATRPWAILLYTTTTGVAVFLMSARLFQAMRPRQQWSGESRLDAGLAAPGGGSSSERDASPRG